MYNNVYQEYINKMIGTTFMNQPETIYNRFQTINMANAELEQSYPELYRLLYPMVQTACMRNTKPISEETINEMVRDIYSNFNADDVATGTSETRTEEVEEARVRRPNNFVLNDLIRILLIRELLGKPGNMPPFRPRNISFDAQNYDIYEQFNF